MTKREKKYLRRMAAKRQASYVNNLGNGFFSVKSDTRMEKFFTHHPMNASNIKGKGLIQVSSMMADECDYKKGVDLYAAAADPISGLPVFEYDGVPKSPVLIFASHIQGEEATMEAMLLDELAKDKNIIGTFIVKKRRSGG